MMALLQHVAEINAAVVGALEHDGDIREFPSQGAPREGAPPIHSDLG